MISFLNSYCFLHVHMYYVQKFKYSSNYSPLINCKKYFLSVPQ